MATTGEPLRQWGTGPFTGGAAVTNNTDVPAGRGIMLTASVAGEVALTMADTTVVTVTVAVGDNIYPFSVTKAVTGTATITRVYNLF